MIVGGIHGNEPIAAELADLLCEHLESNPGALGGRCVVLVQHANPDGLRANTRGNATGVDLNRNFPAENFAASSRNGPRPLSEPESRALFELISETKPACIVSLHGPLACIDPDGGEGSTDLARRMAAVSSLPVKDLEAYPGSLGSYCGDTLGINTITYELDRKSLPPDGLHDYLRPHLPALLLAIREGTGTVAK